jgi:hypothetical protein
MVLLRSLIELPSKVYVWRRETSTNPDGVLPVFRRRGAGDHYRRPSREQRQPHCSAIALRWSISRENSPSTSYAIVWILDVFSTGNEDRGDRNASSR